MSPADPVPPAAAPPADPAPADPAPAEPAPAEPLTEAPPPPSAGHYLLPPRPALALLIGIGAAQGLAVVVSVLLLRRIVDELAAAGPASAALPLVLGFAAVGVALAAVRAVEYTVAERIGYQLVARLRMTLYQHLLDLPARSVTRSSQGAILLRFTGDLSTYRTWISRGLSRGVIAACTLVGGLVVFLLIDWVIGLAVVGTLLIGAAGSALLGYQVRRTTRSVRWRRSLLASNVAEQIRSLAVVQTYGRSRGETARLGRQNDDLLGALGRAAGARGVLRFVSSASASLAVGAVLIVGVLELDRGRVSLGGVLAAITAARFITNPIRTLGRSYEYWQAAQVSRRKLEDFLARERRAGLSGPQARLRPRRGAIELRGVSLGQSLHDIDLVVEPGELVAITGDNGAGKSTLLSLLTRSVTPEHGQILIDGQDLAQCSIDSTVRNIGMVSADLPLMKGTIRRNITYRYRHATDDLIEQVVLGCRVDEVLDTIDGGLSGWVVEGGANLSLGHRQRVLLARATLGNPRILLLDEPSTNLDAATREVFRRVVSRYRGTVLLVTHDPVEASLADRVVVMGGGRIRRQLSGAEYRQEQTGRRRVEAGRPVW